MVGGGGVIWTGGGCLGWIAVLSQWCFFGVTLACVVAAFVCAVLSSSIVCTQSRATFSK